MTQCTFGITGWKNSGKTMLAERLVTELTRRGRRVATVKHAHHSFDIDRAGTDSFRHRKAGAHEVAVVSSNRWALIHELDGEEEPPLDDILAKLSPADIVLVEGYKREMHPKIECRRLAAIDTKPMDSRSVPAVVAIAADYPVPDAAVPVFSLDDVSAIADFVEGRTGLR